MENYKNKNYFYIISAIVTLGSFPALNTGIPGVNSSVIAILMGILLFRFEFTFSQIILSTVLALGFAIDALWVLLLGKGDFGYSLNFLKLIIFVLAVKAIAKLSISDITWVFIIQGFASIASEVFIIFNPDLRTEFLINSKPVETIEWFDFYRPTGLIGDPNYFSIPLALAFSSSLMRKNITLSIFFFLSVLLTGSRSALVAVAVVFLYQIFIDRKLLSKAQSLFVVAGIILFLFFLPDIFTVFRPGGNDESNYERFSLLMQGGERLFELSFLQSSFGQPVTNGIDGSLMVIHNFFLQTAATSLSLLFVILFIIHVAWGVHKLRGLVLVFVVYMMFLDLSSSVYVLFGLIVLASKGMCRKSEETL